MKKIFGCGYEPQYAGKAMTVSNERDLKGICPTWWRKQPFVESVLYASKFRNNLGNALLWPAKLGQALIYYDIFESELANKRLNKEK